MPFKPHEHIHEPSKDTVVWRYYSTSQFLWVLQNRALYFSRLDELDDPFEGYSPLKNIEEEVKYLREERRDLMKLWEGTEYGSPEEMTLTRYESTRQMSLVNCWSMGEEESLAMWKSYLEGGEGVVIRTTFSNLTSAIDEETEHDYFAGMVDYFDYFGEFFRTSNIFKYIMSKPKQYQFERELRLFFWLPNHEEVKEIMEQQIEQGEDGETVKIPEAPAGIPFDIDLDTLIEDIYISPFDPPWVTPEYWSDILERYGLDVEPKMSKLAMEPASVLGHD